MNYYFGGYMKSYIKYFVFMIIIVCFSPNITAKRRHIVDVDRIEQEAISTYKKVYNHYTHILELANQVDQAPLVEKDYHMRKLTHKIAREVQQDKFPLYGNFFNKMWRNMTASSAETPLIRFDGTLIEDSIGHVQKAYTKLLNQGFENSDIAEFIQDMNNLRERLRSSVYYQLEVERAHKEAAQAEIVRMRAELMQEKARRHEAEKNLEMATKQLSQTRLA
jgi:hypothetical protein